MTPAEFLAQPLKFAAPDDSILRTKCQPVEKIERWPAVAKRMIDAMLGRRAMGLAAPQVGLPYQMFVARIGAANMTFINPEIVDRGWRQSIKEEGCLSLPGTLVKVERHHKVKVHWCDEFGLWHVAQYEGLAARTIQHEIDHLNGILITDKETK